MEINFNSKMSQFIIYLSCFLAMVCQVKCATKTACTNERIQLRLDLEAVSGDLVNAGRKEMASFYNKGLKCQGYMNKQSPFPTNMLKGSLRDFVGNKFMKRNYDLFRPFYDAFVAITNDSTSASTKTPELQLSIIHADVTELLLCIYVEDSSLRKRLIPVKYDASLHRKDVETCLVNAGIKATTRRVKIIQYSEIFDELHKAVTGMGNIASLIKFLKLK